MIAGRHEGADGTSTDLSAEFLQLDAILCLWLALIYESLSCNLLVHPVELFIWIITSRISNFDNCLFSNSMLLTRTRRGRRLSDSARHRLCILYIQASDKFRVILLLQFFSNARVYLLLIVLSVFTIGKPAHYLLLWRNLGIWVRIFQLTAIIEAGVVSQVSLAGGLWVKHGLAVLSFYNLSCTDILRCPVDCCSVHILKGCVLFCLFGLNLYLKLHFRDEQATCSCLYHDSQKIRFFLSFKTRGWHSHQVAVTSWLWLVL